MHVAETNLFIRCQSYQLLLNLTQKAVPGRALKKILRINGRRFGYINRRKKVIRDRGNGGKWPPDDCKFKVSDLIDESKYEVVDLFSLSKDNAVNTIKEQDAQEAHLLTINESGA